MGKRPQGKCALCRQECDKANIEIRLCVKEMNDLFLTYYHSGEEIQKCV